MSNNHVNLKNNLTGIGVSHQPPNSRPPSLKLLVIGQASTGKTSIINRYIDGFFSEPEITIGVDFKTKLCEFEKNNIKQTYQLQIWDTAGQERFNAIVAQFFRNMDGLIFVIDMTDPSTFNDVLERWLPRAKSISPVDAKYCLIINKTDKYNDTTLIKNVRQYCEDNNYMFATCSAQSGENITEIFESISNKIVKDLPAHRSAVTTTPYTNYSENVNLSKQIKNHNHKKINNCC